jgi:hypothetical protein
MWVRKAESDLSVARNEAAAPHPERDPVFLVPTLCVGTHVRTLCVPADPSARGVNGTQSVRLWVPTQSVGTRKCS